MHESGLLPLEASTLQSFSRWYSAIGGYTSLTSGASDLNPHASLTPVLAKAIPVASLPIRWPGFGEFKSKFSAALDLAHGATVAASLVGFSAALRSRSDLGRPIDRPVWGVHPFSGAGFFYLDGREPQLGELVPPNGHKGGGIFRRRRQVCGLVFQLRLRHRVDHLRGFLRFFRLNRPFGSCLPICRRIIR